MATELTIGVLGLGMMGRLHVMAYQEARRAGLDNRIVAVCDLEATQRSGDALGALARGAPGFQPSDVTVHVSPLELLADDRVHAVSICTPTASHVELAVRALEAGKHVLVETPVATTVAEAARLVEAARGSGRICMPATPARFWSEWRWFHDHRSSREYGPLQSLSLHRIAPRPAATAAPDHNALHELQIHNADFIHWCFGMPTAVHSRGTVDSVKTTYDFDGKVGEIIAESGYADATGRPLLLGYTAVFKTATADFEFGRDPALRVLQWGKDRRVSMRPLDGFRGQVLHFLRVLHKRDPMLEVTPRDALNAVRIVCAERQSLQLGRKVALT